MSEEQPVTDAGASALGNEEVLYTGKPNCCGAPVSWCRNTKWLVTVKYIEREKGVCCVSIDNLQLIRVKDLQYRSSCCCSCCGTITVFSTDKSCPELHLSGLPGGREIYGRLRDAVTALQSRAKIEIEA